MALRITIIGAGSAVFSLSLIRDLCLTPRLSGSTVVFMDIDQERLDTVHSLCRRYAAEVGTQLQLEKTTDRRQALADADFVVNTALAAGHHRLRAGWEIARKLGYRFGGSLHVMHDEAFWINFYQLRLFEELAEDILDLCPNAWCLLVSNPVLAGVTYLARKYPRLKLVGLCHGFSGVYHLADVLHLDRDKLTFQVPGVNHHVWLTHIYHEGRDVFPLLEDWIAQEAPTYWETCGWSDDLGPKAVDLYRRFGVFPIGDTCTPGGGAWPWWYHTSDDTERRWREDPAAWWQRHFQWGESKVRQMSLLANNPDAKLTEHFPPQHSGEVMVPMMESLYFDVPRVLIGNVPNTHQFVPGIPTDFAVEVPLLVSRRGVEPVPTQGLPGPVVDHITRDRVAPVNTELTAYETGSLEMLRQLVLMDPWTRSEEQAVRLVEEILAMPEHEAI